MAGKKEPQSFAMILGDADKGRIDKLLSEAFHKEVEYTTDRASLHECAWKSEITIKVKITAEPHGKVELAFSRPATKRQEEGMPKARMFYNPDTEALSAEEPRQVKIPGFDNDGRPVRSAGAPGTGGSDKN